MHIVYYNFSILRIDLIKINTNYVLHLCIRLFLEQWRMIEIKHHAVNILYLENIINNKFT
jgi:hypothetical protein